MKSMTVKKGPQASGVKFGFRYAAGKEGRLEIGSTPVAVDLTTPEAKKADLEKVLKAYVGGGFLSLVEDAEPETEQPARRRSRKSDEESV